MSQHEEHHSEPGAGGEGYEPDMAGSTPTIVAIYFVVLSAVFFATLGALYMYFRYETERELERKVYSIESEELKKLRAEEEAALKGKIDAAIKATTQETGAK